MAITRVFARPLLASIFVLGGVDAVLNPGQKAPKADTLIADVPARLGLSSTEQLVRIDGGAKVLGGLALATGRLPRLASLGLAVSLVPTTLAGHAFWSEKDAVARKTQRLQFAKNLSILGGLVLAVVDTEGKPSVGWRVRRATRRVQREVKRDARTVKREAKLLKHDAKLQAKLVASGKLPA